ncbi:NmrA/HSCARG family protein [Steroidobacter flavus]|uniref:NmrA/HSCARG family protein n=1 Tax=Steroidobacter flavus TaxID=1842136 RepID=A0ABV8SKG7_9GAMM
MTKPIIAVVGATGAQGGGLVRSILSDPDRAFSVRAISRKIDSPAARELAGKGAEVVFGDLDDPASLERAFKGAHGVYAVTNFWEHFSPEREHSQAQNIADAARRADVSHIIWSTLEDTRERVPLHDQRMPTLMQRYKVPHFDAKGESDALFRGLPTTFLRTSFYWDNLIYFGMGPRRGEDGTLNFLLPMGEQKLAGIAAADIGACAFGIFKRGSRFIGQTVGIAGGHLTGSEMSAELSAVLGEPVRHVSMPHAVYAQLGFPGAEDLANMFQYYCDFNAEFSAQRPVALSRELHPGLLSFGQWAALHRDRLRASLRETS